MFYLRAKVKGALSSSRGLESLKHLEGAFFPLRDSFDFHLAPNKSQAAGPELHGGKTNSAQEPPSYLCRLFQTTNWDVLTDKNGWIYGETTGRDVGSRRSDPQVQRPGGPAALSPLWALAPGPKDPGRNYLSGSRHVFLCRGLDSKGRAGQERPCFLRVELLLPWKRPFWPTGRNNIPQSFQEL